MLPWAPKVTFVSHWENKKQPVRVNKSVEVSWVYQFYKLRNDIIHGSLVKPDGFLFRGTQRHFDIATMFFVLGVKQLMGRSPGIKPTYDLIRWGILSENDNGDERTGEGFVYDKGDLRELLSHVR